MYDIFNLIGNIFGYVLWVAFELTENYGVAIIIFTIVLKLVMFPLSIKQQKSMAVTARLSAKQSEIQEKYKNDKEKVQEEINKLYQREGASPTSGCLTSLLPMLLLLGVYYAVINPLTNTLHLASDAVNNAIGQLATLPGIGSIFNTFYGQIDVIRIAQQPDGLDFLGNYFDPSSLKKISELSGGFNFLGLDLLGRPNDGFSILIIIPILCLVSSIASQLITTKMSGNAQAQQGCMKAMIFIMPLFSAYIAYTVPAAVGFYWIISTVIGLIQSIIMNKKYNPSMMGAQMEARRVALLMEEESSVKPEFVQRFRDNGFDINQNDKKKKNKKK